ncbi:enoyl-CoA hydratase [Alphaproteobacteria bacterium]|nr:enoyl-CoA hydratase [Alphaproteobacteria bacterium]
MAHSPVSVEFDGPVGIITISRGDARKNAVSREIASGLREAVEKLDWESSVRAIVLIGEAEALAAGWDVDDYAARPVLEMPTEKPVVVAASGWTVGSGLELVLNADIAIAADNAKFSAPEVSIGELDRRIAQPLIEEVGRAMAADMLMTGRALTADEALSVGLISRVVPLAGLRDAAVAIARRVAEMPETAMKEAKAIDRM